MPPPRVWVSRVAPDLLVVARVAAVVGFEAGIRIVGWCVAVPVRALRVPRLARAA